MPIVMMPPRIEEKKPKLANQKQLEIARSGQTQGAATAATCPYNEMHPETLSGLICTLEAGHTGQHQLQPISTTPTSTALTWSFTFYVNPDNQPPHP